MKVLILGSGPIEIGQAAEFDYAGTQACQALLEEGVEVVLLNSNPATIMTDPKMAGRVYIEPLTIDVVRKIIRLEKPDGILATTGGQTGLNLARELAEAGVLEQEGVKILGTDITAIQRGEDRSEFRKLMQELGQPIPESTIVTKVEEAIAFAENIGFPVVVRPAFTLGGSGGGVVENIDELKERVRIGLQLSPIKQVLLEQSIAGMREVEYEVLRDSEGNTLIVCEMENIDPVGVHTGDSIVVAPALTLSNQEKQLLELAALKIVESLNVVGSCNVQFALGRNLDYYVIEVNPRVSRSSALASKATGYPIARVAAKIAIGKTLIEQDAFKRPNLDYVVTKIPRWPFDKFPTANRLLGTQMKATGEVMAIGRTFTESLQKAIRSLELDNISLLHPEARFLSEEELIKRLIRPDDMRIHLLAEFLRRGGSVEELVNLTNIHPFFLHEIDRLVKFFLELCSQEELNRDLLREAKRLGFSDEIIGEAVGLEVKTIRDFRVKWGIRPSFCKVDAGILPYYYSTYNKENEVVLDRSKQTVIVLGSGPIRIGQGIEFDFSTVHAAWTIRDKGYAAVIINNNPETVSTDYFTSDRLYFEPLVEEDVWEVIQFENPEGVLVQFGGQTAINLVRFLENEQIAIKGTTAENTFGMEDRKRFDKAMETLEIPRPAGYTADTIDEAFKIAEKINYPVVVRPSFVLGGRGMEVVGNQASLREYLTGLRITQEAPLLIDSYIAGLEVELDAISDGEDVFIPGVMEHLERAGVHSGDSIAVFPSQNLSADTLALIADYTKRIANYFQVKGFLNIQFVIANNTVYVLEVNPRSSRTIPFLSKVTGISLAELATRVVLGEKLSELGYVGLRQFTDEIISVKVPVFSFAKLLDTEINLGPEMKSTGEVMGRAKNLARALYKGFIAAKVPVSYHGKALVTVADKDKAEIVELARALDRQGFDIYATEGTCKTLQAAGITCKQVVKLQEGSTILDLIQQGEVNLVINTITHGKQPQRDGFKIRRAAVESGVLCFTSLDTARAYLDVVADRDLWLEPIVSERR